MKFKTTMKEMKNKAICYCFGYGDLQSVLTYENPIAYTCGTYGWNADIYQTDYDNTVIVTGYRPFGYSLQDSHIARLMDEKAKKYEWYDKKRKEKVDAIRDDLFRLIHADYRAFHSSEKDKDIKARYIAEYNSIHDELTSIYSETNN